MPHRIGRAADNQKTGKSRFFLVIEGKGSRVSQGDNNDTHVDPEPQITTASVLIR
jgi:hypothetical protein